ncbi:MAG TPA: protein translocase subunit SecF [Kofleriaceae bacterium]|nr:protein translocase subunit SecF [Kofleriaceae bacterium]
MTTHKKFRELIKPGTNFEFVGRAHVWILFSILISCAAIGMLFVNHARKGEYLNWNTDFKGGTELIFEFCDPKSSEHVSVDPGKVRSALTSAGFTDLEISDFTWNTGAKLCLKEDESARDEGVTVHGMLVRTPDFGALDAESADRVRLSFIDDMQKACLVSPTAKEKKWTDKQCTVNASWAGDRMFVHTLYAPDEQAVRTFFKNNALEVKPGDHGYRSTKQQGVEEFGTEITVSGLDQQFRAALDTGLDGIATARVVQSYGVGAKAGKQLRNDGITSIVFAMALIMLYLAFRFDIRYSPGAVVAMLHDAIIVIGAYAVTWTEFSLTTVAAILTVIGYSVNDTVIIFDRIRENTHKLKDKKLDRIVNISVNETLGRSVLTSLTVFVVTLMMNIFGVGLVANFAFAMNVGVIVGTYSSIFIASPVFLWIDRKFYPPKGPAKPGERARLKKSEEPEPEELDEQSSDSDDEAAEPA